MQLSDDNVWQVTKVLYSSFQQEEQEKKLDIQRLAEFKKQHIKPLYPHKISQEGENQKYTCKQSCCEVNPGYFCCCHSTEPDISFRRLGLGICLYFKFMKHVSTVLIPVTILALSATIICMWVCTQNGFSLTQNYSNFFFSTTLGVFASEHSKCTFSKINQQNTTNYPFSASTTLNCPYGKVNYFGAVFSNQSQPSLYNCRKTIEEINRQQSLATPQANPSSLFNNCTGSAQCQIRMDLNSDEWGSTTVGFGYQCLDQVYDMGLRASSSTLFYILVGSDLFICLILLAFYVSQKRAEHVEIDYFKSQQLSLQDYSLKIKGFRVNEIEEELQALLRFLGRRLGEQSLEQIVQIKMPDRVDFIEYQLRKEQAYKQLYKFMDKQFFDKEVNPCRFKSPDNFQDYCFSKPYQYAKFKSQLAKYLQEYLQEIYRPASATDDTSAAAIYIVFNSIRMKQDVYALQEESCFNRYLLVRGKAYEVTQPPAPDLIIWKNKGKNLVCRSIISWLATLLICFASYVLFGFLQLEQNSLLSEYNFNLNCEVLYPSQDWSAFNSSLTSDANYFSCFCIQNLFNFGQADYSRCSKWRVQYVTYLAIPIIMSLLIVVYDVVVSQIFRLLTTLEAHRLVANQLFSFTIKRAFLLIMNMGLVVILLNTQYSHDPNFAQDSPFSFLVQGKYGDISADWYLNIGTILILTMLFNITFPLIELALASLLKCLKRCWDKKLGTRKTSCKTKQEYNSLFSQDIYPIEERYAFLIATFIITLAFSCVIPILYLICFLSILLLYLIDKLLIFKLYQTPINYSTHLHSLISKALYIGLVAHMALSAVFLSEPQLIAASSEISQGTITGNDRIDAMLNTFYILPYLGMLFLLLGWSVFDGTVMSICRKWFSLCDDGLSHLSKYKINQDYYDSINYYQLQKLKRITQSELDKIMLKNQQFAELQVQNHLDQTSRELSRSYPLTQRQIILRDTLQRIIHTFQKIAEEQTSQVDKRRKQDLCLFGMPGYEIMMNDEAFDQNRKNIILSEELSRCCVELQDQISNKDL